jgi:hypothetical protein
MSPSTCFVSLSAHESCYGDSCKVQYFSNLHLNITLYLDELSRVFFKKENLTTRDGYWISTFYSFCIQATVRKLLQTLSRCTTPHRESALSASKQYLHLAINLFIASSGTYDPLTTDYSVVEPGHVAGYEDIFLLQQTLGGPVQSSADYLRNIFEMKIPTYQSSPFPEPPLETKRHGWYSGPISPEDPSARDQAAKCMERNMLDLEVLVAVATSKENGVVVY